MPFTPLKLLLPYQREVYSDPARWMAWVAARQVGKSFTAAARAVAWAMSAPRTDVLVASPSERQSYEAVLKCRQWSEAFGQAIADVLEERDAPGALMRSSTITYPNGSRIIAVPGKPDTVRGFSAHVWIDEFAFLDDPDATWKAVFPTVSNPLRGLKHMMVTSTPNGLSGRGARFARIVSGAPGNGWSVHTTTVLDAAPALGLDPEELRRAVDDEEAWRQEYMCEFADTSSTLLPYDLIAQCESASASCGPLPPAPGPLWVGIDFGRQGDPTVCWSLERDGGRLATREVLVLKATSTPEQWRVLRDRVRLAGRCCLDYTGPGVGLGDLAAEEFGEWKPERHEFGRCELCVFTPALKQLIFPRLRKAFEGREVSVPADTAVREDLHEMRQTVRDGRYTYTARRTAAGHSDRCTALALALRAAAAEAADFEPRGFGRRGGTARKGWKWRLRNGL